MKKLFLALAILTLAAGCSSPHRTPDQRSEDTSQGYSEKNGTQFLKVAGGGEVPANFVRGVTAKNTSGILINDSGKLAAVFNTSGAAQPAITIWNNGEMSQDDFVVYLSNLEIK